MNLFVSRQDLNLDLNLRYKLGLTWTRLDLGSAWEGGWMARLTWFKVKMIWIIKYNLVVYKTKCKKKKKRKR